MLTISITVNDVLRSTVSAIVDTGASCSCVNLDFQNRYFPNRKLEKLRTCTVKQASGSSMGALGMIEITFTIEGHIFKHEFIVCSALKTGVILGLDFAQSYRIGIDWNDAMEPYLGSRGKYLTTAMPLQALNPKAIVQMVQSQSQQRSIKQTKLFKIKNSLVSRKPKPMVRLLSRIQVRLPPKMLSVVPVTMKEPHNTKKLRTMDVVGYDSLYVEFPDLSVLPDTHTKMNKNKAGYVVLFVYNSGDEELIVNKSTTLALGTKSAWKVKSGRYTKGDVNTTLETYINHLSSHEHSPKDKKTSVRNALEHTAFVGQHNTNTKPKVTLKDVPLSPALQQRFEELKDKYNDIFLVGPSDIGITDLAEMTIDTKPDVIPYTARLYKLALQHQEILRREIQALLDTGIIVPSISQYTAPCMVVPRKCRHPKTAQVHNLAHLVIYYKKLNKNLLRKECERPNANGTLALVPQPRIKHMWSTLKDKKVFSSVDLKSSYHHILIKPEDRHKIAFVCDFGKFEFTRASFGIATSPDFLKDLMNKLFFGFGSFCVIYMDDLLIFSDSPEQHLEHLERIFAKFPTSNLKVKLSKSDFFKEELVFLGHKIGIHSISPADEKISAIQRIKPPKNVKEVHSVVGLLGFLNFFIPTYSEMIRHMTRLTHKNTPFVWDEKCQKSLDLAKKHLESALVMIYPDKSKPFHLFTDPSNYTWSVALMQMDDNTPEMVTSLSSSEKKGGDPSPQQMKKDKPPYAFFEGKPLKAIVYHSGSFQGSQLAWSAFVKESFSILKSILRMTFHLTDSHVIIHSDHKLLQKFIYAITAND